MVLATIKVANQKHKQWLSFELNNTEKLGCIQVLEEKAKFHKLTVTIGFSYEIHYTVSPNVIQYKEIHRNIVGWQTFPIVTQKSSKQQVRKKLE